MLHSSSKQTQMKMLLEALSYHLDVNEHQLKVAHAANAVVPCRVGLHGWSFS
jgi:hypothetical protein